MGFSGFSFSLSFGDASLEKPPADGSSTVSCFFRRIGDVFSGLLGELSFVVGCDIWGEVGEVFSVGEIFSEFRLELLSMLKDLLVDGVDVNLGVELG